MLQSVRDNLKGTVAVFVLAIFIIPLILFGVEQLFVGSLGGAEVATVNGESINRVDFQRELTLEKQRLQQQFELEPNNPQLDDSVLSGPVLQRMVQREALYQAAVDGGMGASTETLWKQIAAIEAFQVDGKFNSQVFKDRISYLYTPATFLAATEKDFILSHINTGIAGSSFVTPEELKLLASITQQKRTFFTVEIPKADKPEVAVTDGDVEQYYQNNSAQFIEPEKVSIDYVELSLDQLASKVQVSEADIQAVYQEEVSNFKADPRYVVAHILIEDKDGAADKVKEVAAKLEGGADFAALAKEYSDDLGSKQSGGNLGILIENAYPKEFVEAAKKLEVGAVSAAVKTDVGHHFIKLVEKTNVVPPTFEERKDTIAKQLATQLAQEEYIRLSNVLDERTFGADSLKYAAEALGVEVQTSELFSRSGGAGVAAISQVVNEAFGDEVLAQGHNSRVIDVGGVRSFVIRLKEHKPEQLKPLADVKEEIFAQLTAQRIASESAARAREVLQQIQSGKAAEDVAKEAGLEYKLHENASRTSFEIGGAVLQKAFSLARPADGNSVFDLASVPGGGAVVVGLKEVIDGTIEDLVDAQKTGMQNQLRFQISQSELEAFENNVIAKAKIKR